MTRAMSRFKEREERQDTPEGWKPSRADVNKLRAGMQNFSSKIVNGKKQYPFELYMEAEGIISFGPKGEMRVKYPLGFKRAQEIYSLHQFIEWEELQDVFAQFPEEKEAYEAKVEKWRSEVRQMLKSVDKSVPLPETR